MRSLRAAMRATLLFLWILFIMAGHLSTRLLTAGSRRARMRARTFWFRLWGRGSLRLMGCQLTVSGPIPEVPYLLVCNHLSYVDVLVMSASLPAVHFVSKAEVRRWPLLGPAARAGQTLFLDRERLRDLPGIVDGLRSVLDDGGGAVFFPEGTTSGGGGVLPFRASLFETPVRTGHPVRCAALCYATAPVEPPASESVCWWRDMEFVSHFRQLLGLTGFRAELRFSGETHRAEHRKLLAERTENAVTRLLEEMRGREMNDIEDARRLALTILNEARPVIAPLSESVYAARRDEIESEGIGTHVRHALEFYTCLLDGLDSGKIDYDGRHRDEALERDPEAAVICLDTLVDRLERLESDLDLEVSHDRLHESEPFTRSSLARELRFVASHAVHHLAIVGMLLRLAGQDVTPDFGVAPSTQVHRRQIGLGTV